MSLCLVCAVGCAQRRGESNAAPPADAAVCVEPGERDGTRLSCELAVERPIAGALLPPGTRVTMIDGHVRFAAPRDPLVLDGFAFPAGFAFTFDAEGELACAASLHDAGCATPGSPEASGARRSLGEHGVPWSVVIPPGATLGAAALFSREPAVEIALAPTTRVVLVQRAHPRPFALTADDRGTLVRVERWPGGGAAITRVDGGFVARGSVGALDAQQHTISTLERADQIVQLLRSAQAE